MAIVLLGIVGVTLLLSRVDFRPDLAHLHASILTGDPKGNYAAIGRRLSEAAAAEGGTLDVVPSAGALDNLQRLSAAKEGCEIAFALSQAGLPREASDGLELVARLRKAESMFFLGRNADAISRFDQLRGLRIGIGPEASGTAALARLVLEARDFADLDLQLSHHELAEQLEHLKSGALDLGVFVIDEDAELVDEAVRSGLQIATFDHLDVVARRHDFLWAGRIGAGQYDPIAVLPAVDKRVLRVDTVVLGNGCASHAQTTAMLDLLVAEFPDLASHNAETPNGSGFALTSTSAAYFREGGPSWADRWLPWIVDVMPPSNWVYIGLVVSMAFNAMGFSHRFRLWRLDVARVAAEGRVAALLGPALTPADIATLEPPEDLALPERRRELDLLVSDLAALRDRCRKHSLSVVVPMGQEMAYRYQEETMHAWLAALRALRRRLR